MRKRDSEVVEENGRRSSEGGPGEDRTQRLVALGRAISDPIRVRMLAMMAEGRHCCDLPDCGVPAVEGDAGICVCEFEAAFGMSQSKVSYHVKKLEDAGLVRKEKRGKWTFYSLDASASSGLLGDAGELLAGTR